MAPPTPQSLTPARTPASALADLAPEHPERQRLRARAEALERLLAGLPTIRTAQELTTAGAILDDINATEGSVRYWLDPICQSTDQAHKTATRTRNEMLAPILKIKDIARRLIADYNERQEAAREALARRELAVVQEAEVRGVEIELPAPPPPVAKAEGHSVRRHYSFKVAAPELLRREYLMPDERKIRAAVNAHGPGANAVVSAGAAPALLVWRDDTVASRKQGAPTGALAVTAGADPLADLLTGGGADPGADPFAG